LKRNGKAKEKQKPNLSILFLPKKDCLKCYEGWWTRVDNFSRLNFPKKAGFKHFLSKIK